MTGCRTAPLSPIGGPHFCSSFLAPPLRTLAFLPFSQEPEVLLASLLLPVSFPPLLSMVLDDRVFFRLSLSHWRLPFLTQFPPLPLSKPPIFLHFAQNRKFC